MCGISALFKVRPAGDLQPVIDAMTGRLHHRGPDHRASWVSDDGRVALGHTRLSIVDLSPRGNQPMASEDGRLLLVCNGEIYNHRALRARLEKGGHRFRSDSDNEVILHLYREHGDDLLAHLRGMFAFALYDRDRDRLLCARDRLGKKPLIYGDGPEGFLCASEIPAALEVPGVDHRLDATALGLYLLRNVAHVPEPWTLYRGLRRLRPGHALMVEGGRMRRSWRYWQPSLQQRPVSADELRQAFDEAVALRAEADVPVAALLSGGVDSSAIVESFVRQTGKTVRTYAIGRDADDEELERARHMARRMGTEHREFTFHPERQHADFEELLMRLGEPVARLPLTYALELCRRIADDGVKVVMGGHGADEIFYGYEGHNAMLMMTLALAVLPGRLPDAVGRLADRLPAGSRLGDALRIAAAPAGARKQALYRAEAHSVWPRFLTAAGRAEAGETAIGDWLDEWRDRLADAPYIDESSFVGLLHENAHSVTLASDLPGMAASVEMRCPFLDQEIVELAFSINYRRKVRDRRERGRNKLILKQALAGRVPDALLYAPKRGFGYHIGDDNVLRGPWKAKVDACFAELDDCDGLLDLDSVRATKRAFDAGDAAQAPMVLRLYALQLARRISGGRIAR